MYQMPYFNIFVENQLRVTTSRNTADLFRISAFENNIKQPTHNEETVSDHSVSSERSFVLPPGPAD